MAYTIKELESLSGVKAHTIRIWEQRYSFLKPSRTGTNIRTYNNEELKTLLTVALLNKYGYKISRINEMPQQQRVQAVMQLPQADAQLEHSVNELIGYMIDMDAIGFEEKLNRHLRQAGIEETITTLIFQFLEKVGILWQTNKIIPVQEHIVSCIIRQKLIAAIDQLPFVRREEPLFLLFLPEDEHHEMGLLFLCYLLRRHRMPVLYLGPNVPLKDIGYIVKIKKPASLFLHLTSFPHHHNFQKFLERLSAQAGDSSIFISGSAVQHQRKPVPAGIHLFQSLAETVTYIYSLK